MGPHHRRIDTGGHPLVRGIPPAWANGSGQDAHGVFVEVEIGEAMLRMRWCPPGRFLMGSPEDEPGRFDVEGPQVEITFRDGFWLMDAPVTQALWQAVMGTNPSRFVSPDRPVEQVSWDDVGAFCAAANARVPGLGLRLPSEAEWEYACRAGTETATYAGTMEFEDTHLAPVLDAIAWYGGNSGADWDLEVGDPVHWSWKAHAFDEAGTRRVRQKRPNPWGFHDMLGNVWEWCADDWSDSYDGASPDGAPREIPEGPSRWDRVIRGGNWRNPARGVRSAFRGRSGDKAGSDDLGFRCVQGQVVSPGGPEGRGS